MSSTEPKQYGLILPSKNKGKAAELGTRKLNPLLDSDDELDQDEESPLNWVEASLKKSAGNSGQQSLQKRLLREALEEDESVFQYDEVYDSMQEAKTAQQAMKDPSVKKPKYIQNLIKHAEKRKLEGERRNERKVQKEREAEGEEFADKESFVTPSYLKKMEELKKAEEEAKLQEMKEEQVDVLKHKNFGVFYSHLFKQRMGEISVKEEPKADDNEGDNPKDRNLRKKDEGKRQKHYRTQRDLSESPERHEQEKTRSLRHSSPSSSDSDTAKKVETYRDRREQYNAMERSREIDREKKHHRHQTSEKTRERRGRSRERHYGRERTPEQERRHRWKHRSRSSERKQRRSRSRSSASQRGPGSGKGDRRSPRRIASTSKTDSPRRPVKKERLSSDREESKESTENKNDKKTKGNSTDGKTNVDGMKIKKESEQEEKEKRQDRIRKLFTKRTVGEKFDQALERYYQRKAEREAQG
ncbi:nuclear speckle splicing regulatory protein 1-like [Portunus trituberculatus]|uniref:nuclear speckle splicing regulatory protein 1-like n=1 Tax=Portunus trituberculatus TaxID=210409 RepID=UPI001E1CC9DF|nr:nuclear speckle splicing regulatory protein 1-like [Portunus trituberculatus]